MKIHTVLKKLYNRRKSRSQTSDNMDRWKAEQGRGREKRKIRRKKSKKKEDADSRKGRKVAKHCVFPMIWGSGGSKSRLAKAAGAEPAGQMRDEKLHAVVARSAFPSQNVQNTPFSDHFWKLRCPKSARRCGAKHISKWKCTKHTILGPLLEVEMSKKCTPLWREAHFEVNMYKTPHSRTTFGSWNVQKVHAVVARNTFRSENVQSTPFSDHFWKLRCPKSARRCGAKHISKWTCTKHTILGPLLTVEMSKKCTPLWREAHFQVKMYKAHQLRTTFGSGDVEKCTPLWREARFQVKMLETLAVRTTFGSSDLAVVARSTFSKSKCSKHKGFGPLLEVQMSLRFTTLHYITLHYTPLHYTTGHYTTLHASTLHSSTLHYTKLHYTTLHYTTLRSTTLHYTTSHYTTLHSTTLYYTTLSSTTLHCLTLHYTPLHYNYNYNYTTTLHYTKLHYTTRHYTTLHYIPPHSTTPHYITLHYITLNDTAPQIDR